MRLFLLLVVAGCASTASSSPPGSLPEAGVKATGDENAAPRDVTPAAEKPAPAVGGSAGSSGTATPVAASPCGPIEGALYCDDFESGLNPVLKPRMSNGGLVVVDQTRAHSGKSALHVNSQVVAYADGEVILGKTVFPTPNNSFFLRAFVYYTPPAPPDNVYLFRLRGVLPNTTTYVEGQIGVIGNPYGKLTAPNFKNLSHTIYHSAIKSADHVSYQTPTAPEVTYGRWVCWEWEVDGVNNSWRLWVDGVEHFTRTWDGKDGTPWVVPTASALSIGVKHDHDEKPSGVEVWYDDLVIATKRVGCGPP